MRQQTDTPFLPRDIHNLYAQFKRDRLQGLAVTDALIKHLEQNNIRFTIKPDEDNRTCYVFIVHPKSLKLTYENPNIAITDCTYQTNKFNLPLLHMIGTYLINWTFQYFQKVFSVFELGANFFKGITGSGKTFSIRFAFFYLTNL